MGLKEFVIEFDAEEASYFAGQSVSGKVILEIGREKRVDALQLTFFGHGQVQWKAFSAGESAKNNNNTSNSSNSRKTGNNNGSCGNKHDKSHYPRTVFAEEIYLNGKIMLVEKVQDDTSITLLPGKHEYPFQFPIPSSAPSTFLGPYGHVKYFVTACLKRPKGKQPHEVKVPFTVNGVLDLNTLNNNNNGGVQSPTTTTSVSSNNQQQRRPSDYSVGEVRKFSGVSITPCLCVSKSVGFLLRLPRVAFVPGEYVQFVAELRNMGRADVSGVTLSLIQETKYYAEDETKTGQKVVISSVKGPSVASGECEIWETNESDCLFLEIPSTPPTNLASCKIIGIEYVLQLEMEIYGRQNVKGQLPILVGTIPLKSTFKDFTAFKPLVKPSSANKTSEFGKSSKSISEILGYSGLVSPSFQEPKNYALSSTTSTIGWRASVGNFIKPPGKHLNHFQSLDGATGNGGGKDDEEEDSDEEFSQKEKQKEDLDLNFIPLYAKYISVYGED